MNLAFPHRVGPRLTPGGELHPGDRVRLNHVRWRSSRVSRPLDALNRSVWRNPYLHRTAGYPSGEDPEELAYGITQRNFVRLATRLERIEDTQDPGGILVRLGHSGTIRPVTCGSQQRPPFANPTGQGIVCCGAPCKRTSFA